MYILHNVPQNMVRELLSIRELYLPFYRYIIGCVFLPWL